MSELPGNPYAIDGRCHNSEPGSMGQECGKPATWIGIKRLGAWGAGFCDDCKERGFERTYYPRWERVPPKEPTP